MATKHSRYALHLLTDSNGQRFLEELLMTDTYEHTSAWADKVFDGPITRIGELFDE